MTRWERTKQLFTQALELSPDERQLFLATACAGEDSLRKELETLLSAHDQAKSFIESPLLGDSLVVALLHSADGSSDTSKSPRMGRTPSASDHFVGRVLSRYRLDQQLGAGGMGVVYRATDLKLGRTVAIKLLAPHLIGDEMAKARFVREARAASKLDHPNIGTIHDIGEDGELFIVMALYEG